MSRGEVGGDLLWRLWSEEPTGPLRGLLLGLVPAEGLFRLIVSIRNSLYDNGIMPVRSSAIDVVSVGNLSLGGTGKTPFAAWLAGRYAEAGRRPAIIHGGYGGDEPALHRRWQPEIPVVVGRDRTAAAASAARSGADVVILDDGFQHRRLARDVDIVLVSAERGLSGVRLLPRGPWREPVDSLRRADAVVVTRKSATREAADGVAGEVARAVGRDRVAVVALKPSTWHRAGCVVETPEGRVLAVAGLASPAAFEDNAIMAGARVAGTMWFRDHHAYTVEDAQRILRASDGGPIVTTAKDAVKLDSLLPAERLWVLEQRVEVESGGEVLDGIVSGRWR